MFRSARIVVFCDGDFWHGRNWSELQGKLRCRANPDYWIAKIGSNRRRDQEVTRLLEHRGWQVLRVWEGDICKDAEAVAAGVAEQVWARRVRDNHGGD